MSEKPLYPVRSIGREGRDEREILADDELKSYAQMSPDGHWIVFDKWQDNTRENGEIYVMRPYGSGPRRLTDNHVCDGYPGWFPGSRTVLFYSEVDGIFKLFAIGVDGAGFGQLTFGPGNDQRADGGRVQSNDRRRRQHPRPRTRAR